jgi:hypothetical protein
MDWYQLFFVFGINSALFLWAWTESRKDTFKMISLIQEIHKELKNHHQHVCSLEKRVQKDKR